MRIAVDFDGTLVDHVFPDIGKEVPGAFTWLKRFREAGAELYLWTMRSDGQKDGDTLSQAVEFCRRKGVEFDGVNQSKQEWTTSPKLHAHVYIDDAAFGCPLKRNPRSGGRPFVDWSAVGPVVLESIRRNALPRNES